MEVREGHAEREAESFCPSINTFSSYQNKATFILINKYPAIHVPLLV